MTPQKIPGPTLLGFGDFFSDDVTLGATPPKPTPKTPVKPPGKGKVPVVLAKPGSGKPSPHKRALMNAALAGKKALAAAQGGAAQSAAYQKNLQAGKHTPLVPVKAVVGGDGQILIGAVTPRVLSPAQRAAVQKHVNAVVRQSAAAKRLSQATAAAQKVGQGTLSFVKTTVPIVRDRLMKVRLPRGTKVGTLEVGTLEEYAAQLGALYEEFYAAVGAAPDPNNPGFLDDGQPDPAFVDPQAAADPNAPGEAPFDESSQGAVTGPNGEVLYDPAQDPALVPLPQRGGTLSQADAQITWQKVPDDGVVYDESQGWPETAVGSWNFFFGPKTGDGNYGDGYYVGANNSWWARNNGAMFPKGNTIPVEQDSAARGWGPLVGKPTSPLAGLQYAVSDHKWFWQSDKAPAWATTEADAAISAANKKTIAANRAAALVEAARMQKDLAAQQEAQAKQDAANALAQSAADTQSQIAQQQVEAQQAQLDVMSQKGQLESAQAQAQISAQAQQAEIQAYQAQAQNQAQAQHALIEQAQVWNAWAKDHPDEAVKQLMGPPEEVGPQGEMEDSADPGGPGFEGGGGYDFGEGGDEGGGGEDALEDD